MVAPPPTTGVDTATTTTTGPVATTTTTPAGPEMVVQVRAHEPVSTRSAVDGVDDGDPGSALDIVQLDLADVARFDEATGNRLIELEVRLTRSAGDPKRPDRLDLFEPGIYPITIQLRRDQTTIAELATFVEVLGSSRFGRGPLTVAVFGSTPDPGPTPSNLQIRRAITAVERMTETALSTSGPVTFAVPPTVLDVVADADPELITRFRGSLTVNDLLLAQPAVAFDPSAAAAAGVGDELTRQIVAGEERLTELVPGVTVARAAWPVTGPLTAGGAALLRDLGIPLLVMPFEGYSELDGNIGGFLDTTLLSNARLPDDAQIRIAVVDTLSERFAGDSDELTPIERAVRVMATVGAVRYGLDPDLRSFVVAAPDLAAPDARTVQALELLISEHPDIATDTLARLPQLTNAFFVDREAHLVELSSSVATDLTPRVEARTAAELVVADTASMLPADDPRPSQWRNRLGTALSSGFTRSEALDDIAEVRAEAQQVRSSIRRPEQFAITFAGRNAEIPVRIENTSDTPLTVVVRVTADKLAVPGGDVTATLDPVAITEVPVPVEARSNGVFPVTIDLLTPAGSRLTEPTSMTARVSSLSGLGRVVTVGAALVLLSWWFSYYRRSRRDAVDASAARHPANGDTDDRTADTAADEAAVTAAE